VADIISDPGHILDLALAHNDLLSHHWLLLQPN
jgi:hypothetical protein